MPPSAFQAVVGSSKFQIFLLYHRHPDSDRRAVGGASICGFLCPFRWFQELLHKIPSPKASTKKLKPLRYLKYVVLLVMVVLLPMLVTNQLGMGRSVLCKYLTRRACWSGAIPAVPDQCRDSRRASCITWKAGVLLAVVLDSVFLVYRLFCSGFVSVGAFSFSVGLNKGSLLRWRVDTGKWYPVALARRARKMDGHMLNRPNHME